MTLTAPNPRAAAGGLDATQVVVAGDQRLFVAPAGTPPPSSMSIDPAAPWVDLGYTTEDGIAVSLGKDTDDLMTSQSLDPVRKLVTGAPKTVTASLRQMNAETLTLALGGGTLSGEDDDWHFTPAASSFIDERALLVEAEDGANRFRFAFYRTMVSEAVEFSFVNTAGVVFPLTFSVLSFEPVTFDVFGNAPGFVEGPSAPPPSPTLTGIAPDEGASGTQVALTGTNFRAGMGVTFGTSSASAVTVQSATAATCNAPPGTGVVDVTVTVPGAAAPATLADAFTYE